MKCNRCEVDHEKLNCLECPTCAAVSKILCLIFSRWKPEEIEDLSKMIRGNTVDNLIDETKKMRAFLLLQVCRLIRHLGFSLPSGPDYLKTRVCDALMKQVGYEKTYASYLTSNNMTHEQGRKVMSVKIGQMVKEALASLR